MTPSWRIAPLDAADRDRVDLLARSRNPADPDLAASAAIVTGLLDAIADAMPRTAPTHAVRRPSSAPTAPPEPHGRADFSPRLRQRLERHLASGPGKEETRDDLPSLVTISLRVEAPEEDLAMGGVRVVLQVHDEQNPLHLCDGALLWTEAGPAASHGFGPRARTHATIACARRPTRGRCSTGCWPSRSQIRSPSTPTNCRACWRTGWRRSANGASMCCGRAAWGVT